MLDRARQHDHRQQSHQHDHERGGCRLGQALVGGKVVGLHGQRVEIEGPHHERRRQFLHDVDKDDQRRREQAAAQQRGMHVPQGGGRAVPEAARGTVHGRCNARQPRIDRLQCHAKKTHQIGIDQRRHAARQQQAHRHAERFAQPVRQRIVELRHRYQHPYRDHGARQGIAHAAEPRQHAQQARPRPAGGAAPGVADGKRHQHRDHRARARQHKAVAYQPDKARSELRVAVGPRHPAQHQRRQQKTERHRQRAPCAGQPAAPARQWLHGRAPLARAAVVVHPRTAAAGPFEPQDRDHEQQHARGQLRRGELVAEREPRTKDAGREGRNAEVRHGAEVGQRLHQREHRARQDAGPRERQRHVPQRTPRAMAEQPRSLERARGLLQECGTRGQVHVGVEHQREQHDRAAGRADVRKPVVARAPAGHVAQPALHGAGELQRIGVRVGDHVGGHRQRQHQRPRHQATPRKAAGRGQPRGGHPEQQHARHHAGQQHERVADVFGQHGIDKMPPGVRGRRQHARHDHADRQHDQRRHQAGDHRQRGRRAQPPQRWLRSPRLQWLRRWRRLGRGQARHSMAVVRRHTCRRRSMRRDSRILASPLTIIAPCVPRP